MKKIAQILICAIVICGCIFSMASCKGGIKSAEAKAHIDEFFAAVVDEDFDKAESLLHPERPADLEEFCLGVEEAKEIDFQEGIEIVKYTGFSSAFYDSSVGGSTYGLTMKTMVGEKEVRFTIEIVKNEAGFGIYNLDINA